MMKQKDWRITNITLISIIHNTECTINVILWRRFKPDSKTINNIIASVKLETTYSKFDKENLKEAISKGLLNDGEFKFIPKGSIPEVEELLQRLEASDDWDDFDDINIHFSSGDVKLFFVYQYEDMSRLYRKYAVNLILLDATHKICKYTIPLFLLVVQTTFRWLPSSTWKKSQRSNLPRPSRSLSHEILIFPLNMQW